MPLQETSGNATTDAYGGGVAAVPQYIEDVFSTWLYTGTGASQTITNNIDLSTKGGLVWIKSRSAATNNNLFDTTRGATKSLHSNLADDAITDANSLTSFNTTGFTLGSGNTSGNQVNTSAATYVSWSLRKQPKFFDVVTWTGNDASSRNITHNLGSVPGFIITKNIDGSTNQPWPSYHRSLGATKGIYLSSTAASEVFSGLWNNTEPTSTQFTVGYYNNSAGVNYIAYLFAHDAGGFGLTGTDNVISCGSFTTDGSGNATVNLGYEPQWVMTKRTNSTGSWAMFDSMRGLTVAGSNDALLFANGSDAEDASASYIGVTSTGLAIASGAYSPSATYIYIAIRRGPMKVPTDATTVFKPIAATTGTQTTNFPIDLQISNGYSTTDNKAFSDRLRGFNSPNLTANQPWLNSVLSNAELTNASLSRAWDNTGFLVPPYYDTGNGIYYNFRRAPSFFDVVCYTGTGVSGRTVTHNLGVAPELMFVKCRSAANGGLVYNKTITASKYLELFFTGEGAYVVQNDVNGFTGVEPTSSVFTVGSYNNVNGSGSTYVAYLFATCAGVSKVGSYTGNGTTQTINCGFTGGARFVLIKRYDSAGDWYTYDTARGMTTLTDPYLFLNTTAAEVATLGSVTTVSTGFALNSTILAAINVSGGTYIFLAIA